MPLSLRARLTLAYGGSFAGILLLLFVSLHRILGAGLMSDLDRQLDAYARDIGTQAANSDNFDDPAFINDVIEHASEAALPNSPLFTVVWNAARPDSPPGVFPARSVNVDPNDLRRLSDAAMAAGEASSETIQFSGSDANIRVRTIPVQTRDGRIVGTIQAGESQGSVDSALTQLERMFLIGGGLGTLLALVLGYVVATQGLRPLKRVMGLANRINARRLDERLAMTHGPREVRELARTFDAMLSRIREAFDQQQRFVADVSHELRTPLTAMRGHIDVLLLDPDLPEELAGELRLISAECSRLIRLSSNLLYIAQAELERPPDMRPVELDVLCLEVLHQMQDTKPGVAVRLVHEDQATVIGDRDRLKQLLLNLLDNAIKYTPAGGSVSLSLSREAGWARIVVADSGVGIPADQTDKIFRRFYTVDQRLDRTVKGAGLGLAIVDWVVQSHHGTIEVDSEVGKGTTFAVRLPLPAGEPEEEEEAPEHELEPAEAVA